MDKLFQQYRKFAARFPILRLGMIALASFLPLIIYEIGAYLWELNTGMSCNEGNCGWVMIGMLSILTVPVGMMWLIVVASDLLWEARKNKNK